MRKIKSLTLQNIGRIENETIEFGTLTRVEGENGAGKSMSCFDPLRIACLGDNFTEDMVREGQKYASIKVTFTDGSWIERIRDRAKNRVFAVDAAGKTVIEGDTVRDLIPEIRKFTGFNEVELLKDDKETFQFTSIDDPQTYLLGGVSHASVLRKLTKVVGGTGAETSKAKIESEVRELNRDKDVQSKMAQDVEKRMAEVWSQVDTPEMDAMLSEMDELRVEVAATEYSIDRINGLLIQEDEAIAVLEQVDKVIDLGESKLSIESMRTIATEIKDKEASIIRIEKVVTQRDRLGAEIPAIPDLAELRELHDRLEAAVAKEQHIANLLSNEDKHLTELEREERELKMLNLEIDDLKTEVAKTSKTCPTCGQAVAA